MTKWIKNVTLFFLAPFIALAYVVLLPFVGIGLMAYYGGIGVSHLLAKYDASNEKSLFVVKSK